MSKFKIVLAALLALSVTAYATAPSHMVLKNQFGETSINVLQGSALPLTPSGNVILLAGATAPVDGTTGDNIAGKGSLYIAKDTGLLYLQTSLITTPVWTIVQAGAASVLATALTGYVSGAGVLASTDTILQGFNKLNGNAAAIKTTADNALPSASFTAAAVTGKLLTGFVSGAGAVAATDTILQGLNKVSGNTQNKALLSFTSSAGSGGGATEAMTLTGFAATDTILSVSQKTPGGNSLPLLGYSTPATNALTGIWSADPGSGAVIVVTVLR